MPQKKQTESEHMRTVNRWLAIPLPDEFKKKGGGTGGIEIDSKDEKILDKAWASEAKRTQKTVSKRTRKTKT